MNRKPIPGTVICYVCEPERPAFIHSLPVDCIEGWMWASLHCTTSVWLIPPMSFDCI